MPCFPSSESGLPESASKISGADVRMTATASVVVFIACIRATRNTGTLVTMRTTASTPTSSFTESPESSRRPLLVTLAPESFETWDVERRCPTRIVTAIARSDQNCRELSSSDLNGRYEVWSNRKALAMPKDTTNCTVTPNCATKMMAPVKASLRPISVIS